MTAALDGTLTTALACLFVLFFYLIYLVFPVNNAQLQQTLTSLSLSVIRKTLSQSLSSILTILPFTFLASSLFSVPILFYFFLSLGYSFWSRHYCLILHISPSSMTDLQHHHLILSSPPQVQKHSTPTCPHVYKNGVLQYLGQLLECSNSPQK